MRRQLIENELRDLLRFSEGLEIGLEPAIQIQRLIGAQFCANDHVADVHRIRQHSVILQLFESSGRVVMIHDGLSEPLYSTYRAHSRRIPSSFNWRSGTVEGASHIRSVPRAVLGKGITSRMEVSPARIITRRSRPSAIPPCGGAPYSSASSRNPNRLFASSSLNPSAVKTFDCTSRRWILMEPDPSSTPFSTRS